MPVLINSKSKFSAWVLVSESAKVVSLFKEQSILNAESSETVKLNINGSSFWAVLLAGEIKVIVGGVSSGVTWLC